MFRKAKTRFARNFFNFLGNKVDKKIVVIESDDWGSIRMSSKKNYLELLKLGVLNPDDRYALFDCLETPDDLSCLFEVLQSVKDSHGKSAVITANCIMANPNFQKIKDSEFNKYYWEDVEDTFLDYFGNKNSLLLWQKGLEKGIFVPQLHGREHVNVQYWLEKLRNQNSTYLRGFERNVFAIDNKIVAAFDYNKLEYLDFIKDSVSCAVECFISKFGFNPKTFIAPNYIWDDEIEKILFEKNILYLQGSKNQTLPVINGNKVKYHYFLQPNKIGQFYIVRNCYFEPALFSHNYSINYCLKEISNAFFWKKPAIISSHRINYVSSLSIKNRDNNLRLLRKLLVEIVKIWPDVIFLPTTGLINTKY